VIRDPAVKAKLARANRQALGLYLDLARFLKRKDPPTLRAIAAGEWQRDHFAFDVIDCDSGRALRLRGSSLEPPAKAVVRAPSLADRGHDLTRILRDTWVARQRPASANLQGHNPANSRPPDSAARQVSELRPFGFR
jgi:hypothetical protein